jgi:hypothetical protein
MTETEIAELTREVSGWQLLERDGIARPDSSGCSIGPEQAQAILKFRGDHGPIRDASELATILSAWPVAEAIWERVDFDPAESTAPEAPGA